MWTETRVATACILCVVCAVHTHCSVITTKVQIEDQREHASHDPQLASDFGPWTREVHLDNKYFLHQIFHKYGNGGVMTFEGFEHLLANLGLGHLSFENHHDVSFHKSNGTFLDLHELMNVHKHDHSPGQTKPGANEHGSNGNRREGHGSKSRKYGSRRRRPGSEESHVTSHDPRNRRTLNSTVPEDDDQLVGPKFHRNLSEQEMKDFQQHPSGGVNIHQQCLTASELMSMFGMEPHQSVILLMNFVQLCPAIIYELDQKHCKHSTCGNHNDHHHHHLSLDEFQGGRTADGSIWLYASASVVVISLCGLLGVAVIPVMQKMFYQHLTQFLVALAVGSLAGDALLHLLPHALTGGHVTSHDELSHEQSPSHHEDGVWKGLMALMCLQFFFLAEKLLCMIGDWKKKKEKKVPAKVRVVKEGAIVSSEIIGEKLCKHKSDAYGYCYGDITMDMLTKLNENTEDHQSCREQHGDQSQGNQQEHSSEEHVPQSSEARVEVCYPAQDHHVDHSHRPSPDERHRTKGYTLQSGRLSPTLALLRSSSVKEELKRKSLEAPADTTLQEQAQGEEGYTVIIREHQNSHHGHAHAHGHILSPPQNISAVAWMVIMGDGLHNFSDGLAIGAAYAAGVTSGLSTSIAVFCHELPHEIGDFAVLLKAGMSPHQAIFYNILSSVLCFFGMILGILLGNIQTASSWIFAGAAGLFLYIALVDMIPELNSSHGGEKKAGLFQLALQFVGISLGGLIMLLIAIYEHDLKTMFEE